MSHDLSIEKCYTAKKEISCDKFRECVCDLSIYKKSIIRAQGSLKVIRCNTSSSMHRDRLLRVSENMVVVLASFDEAMFILILRMDENHPVYKKKQDVKIGWASQQDKHLKRTF